MDGTNEWIWKHTAFQNWTSEGGILWISGKPGSGKSVLAKSIQNRLLRSIQVTNRQKCATVQTPPTLICDWFYSRRHGRAGISYISMLRAILFRVLQPRPDLFVHFAAPYRATRQEEGVKWSWPGETLISIAKSLAHGDISILCIVDALDESGGDNDPENSRETSLRLIYELTTLERSPINFIILSRDTPEIRKKLKYCRSISLEKENLKDVESLVIEGINSLKSMGLHQLLDDSDKESIPRRSRHPRSARSKYHKAQTERPAWSETELKAFDSIQQFLMNNANGVVLWVTLVLKELQHVLKDGKGFTVMDLTRKAKSLPVDLRSYYIYILQSILDKSTLTSLSISRRILTWTIGASSVAPVHLNDIWEVMAIPDDQNDKESSHEEKFDERKVIIKKNWNRFNNILYEYCGPLVEIICPQETMTLYLDEDGTPTKNVAPNWTVQLLHQTTKEFLFDAEASSKLFINPNDINTTSYPFPG